MFQAISKTHLFATTLVCAGLIGFAPACGDSDGTDGSSETSGESGSGTGESGETTAATETTTTGSTTSTDESTSGGFVPTDTGDTTGETTSTGPQPNGSQCSADSECESEICVDIGGFAGVCSECRTDAECMDSGDGLNCSIGADGFFACGQGEQGTMCMSDEACGEGLVCAQVVDLNGFFNDQFCSECNADEQCADGQLCVPDFDLGAFTGERVCAEPGSLENNSLCDSAEQCATGICGTADVMGFLQFGVCGDCETDADCDQGQTCTPASADVLGGGGLMGGTCG